MPPKSSNKKTPAASWFHCEKCDVHITLNDRETHDAVCPIGKGVSISAINQTPLEYIRNNELYTASLECRTFSIDELKEVPDKYVNNIVFVSEGAMRLAQFHIGQKVIIECAADSNQVPPLIRSLWPVPEKFLTTVFLSEHDFSLHSKSLKGFPLKIHGISGDSVPSAKVVRFKLSDPSAEFDERQYKDMECILRQEIKHLIYVVGSVVHLNFFNLPLQFSVIHWTSCTSATVPSIEESLENMKLNDNIDCFQITNRTIIEIEKNRLPVEDPKPTRRLITKSDIGGLDKELRIVEQYMNCALQMEQVPSGLKFPRAVLLYGPSGCGKTMISKAMCAVAEQNFSTDVLIQNINICELFSKFLGESEKNLNVYFEKAFKHYPKPTLIIVEDVHTLCPAKEGNDLTKRVSLAFMNMLDSLGHTKEAQRTFLLATTSKIESLNVAARRSGRFDVEIEIDAPTSKGRNEILKILLREVDHDIKEDFIETVASTTHAYVGGDLANVVSTAYMEALKSGNSKLNSQDIQDALIQVKPSAMREVLIENPNVRWSDIGGQADLKLKLMQAIEWPLKYPENFKRLGIQPPRGLLMFGPPGCSKTLIAKALATESNLNFLSIKGPELFSMWVGESERAVREVFRKARQVAPSIVFFDEIDAIGGERSADGSAASVKERVLTQLLTELDGVEELRNVTVVAATNRPDMIDKALMRPGRLDRIVYVGLPNAEARFEIFKIKLRNVPLANDVNIKELTDLTEGYSGAEIQAICQEAALNAIGGGENLDAQFVEWKDFQYALSILPPRTSSELLRLYEEYLSRK